MASRFDSRSRLTLWIHSPIREMKASDRRAFSALCGLQEPSTTPLWMSLLSDLPVEAVQQLRPLSLVWHVPGRCGFQASLPVHPGALTSGQPPSEGAALAPGRMSELPGCFTNYRHLVAPWPAVFDSSWVQEGHWALKKPSLCDSNRQPNSRATVLAHPPRSQHGDPPAIQPKTSLALQPKAKLRPPLSSTNRAPKSLC